MKNILITIGFVAVGLAIGFIVTNIFQGFLLDLSFHLGGVGMGGLLLIPFISIMPPFIGAILGMFISRKFKQ